MSKNLEVLLKAKETTQLFKPKDVSQKCSEPRPSPRPVDPVGSPEEADLVRQVFLLAHEIPRLVVFCGVGEADGAIGICATAAENLANQTNSSVCIVEGNFHAPSVHRHFGVNNSRGLTDAIFEPGPILDFVCPLPGSNLSVLSAGSRCREAQALWKSEWLRARMEELRSEFAYVLIYCSHANRCVDAMLLGQIADGVILILESMVTRRETARAVKENLAAANVKILAAVLNNHSYSIPEGLYRRL